MDKIIEKLQIITLYTSEKSHFQQVKELCNSGAKWIQLRVKEKTNEELRNIAKKCISVCKDYNVKLIINDYPEIAAEVNADGVHLGKNDMPPIEARKLLGDDKIIGGTANNFEDISHLHTQKVDYIGLGPYRFTTTKKKLSSILGNQGYESIIQKCNLNGISIPILAIGGILSNDVLSIRQTGVHGVAVSGAIIKAANMKEEIKDFYSKIN